MDENKLQLNEEFEYSKENIVNLGFLCANKVLHELNKKIPGTLRILKDSQVKLNFFLNYGEIIHGYIGHDLKMDECYTSNIIIEAEKMLIGLNKIYSEPSCFFHFNLINLLPMSLRDLTFPCEVIKIDNDDFPKMVRVSKLYFNNLKVLIDVKDTPIYLGKKLIVDNRKKQLEIFKQYNKKLEEYIIKEEDIEFHTLKNIPSHFISKLKYLYDDFQCNKLAECVVTIRRLKKGKDFALFNDFVFKRNLDTLSDMITQKLASKTKSILKESNYTIKI